MKLTLKLTLSLAIVALIGAGMYFDHRPFSAQDNYPTPDTLQDIPSGCGAVASKPDTGLPNCAGCNDSGSGNALTLTGSKSYKGLSYGKVPTIGTQYRTGNDGDMQVIVYDQPIDSLYADYLFYCKQPILGHSEIKR